MTVNKGNGSNTSFWGSVVCVAGMVLAVIGAYFVSVALGTVGIVLGVVGYALGARRLGAVTVILGWPRSSSASSRGRA